MTKRKCSRDKAAPELAALPKSDNNTEPRIVDTPSVPNLPQVERSQPQPPKRRPNNGKGIVPTFKQHKIASLVIEGKTQAEIAQAVGSKAKPEYLRQVGYDMVKADGVKAVLASSTKSYNPESLRAKLAKILEDDSIKVENQLRAVELGMRSEAMLTEKVDQTTHNQALTDLSTVNESALVAELAKRMQLSSQGIRTSGAEVAQSETCGVETEIGKSAVSH